VDRLVGAVDHHAFDRARRAVACRALAYDDPSALPVNSIATVGRANPRANPEQTIVRLRQALRVEPDRVDLLHSLGAAYLDANDLPRALSCFQRIRDRAPSDVNAANACGIILRKQGEPGAAIDAFRVALLRSPQDPLVLNNLGNALRDLGRLEESIAAYRQALGAVPDSAMFLINLAGALQDAGAYEEAEHTLRRVLAIEPDNHQARFDLALLLLLLGRFEEGWVLYGSRWNASIEARRGKPCFSRPVWKGEALGNRTLLIHREQGFGDTIQFLRYIPLVRERLPDAEVYVVLQPALCRLARRLAAQHEVRVVEEGTPLPEFDRWCMLLDLPGIFRTTLQTIPARVPYLAADRALRLGWVQRLLDVSGLLVGLAWAGSPTNARDRLRSVPFEAFEPLLDVPGVQWISLQVGEASGQIRASPLGRQVADWTEEVGDFADTAAIVSALDLVIGVDTSVLHLAGALGTPAWVLVRHQSEWRWMADRVDSPWYPTLRLFRQSGRGGWVPDIARIKEALLELVEGRSFRAKIPQWL